MKKIPAVLALALIMASPGASPAAAELCAIDAVPAATLLLPYFEVDMGKFPKLNKVEQTIISIQNFSPDPTIAHVILWTDLSVPTVAFDVFLDGWDVEEVNLAELFYKGEIRGLRVDAGGGRGFVLGVTPSAGIQTLGELIRAHRGESVDGKCYGVRTGDNRARGYVTVDHVNEASILFPNDPGYFSSGGSGVASNTNQLFGFVKVASKKAIQTNELVHIEAASASAGDYTFYGRYVSNSGSDGREPLGTTWGTRFSTGSEPTELLIWRDSGAVQGPFTCSELGSSGWYPLDQVQVVAFDDDGEPMSIDSGPLEDERFFAAEAMRIRINSGALPSMGIRSGWFYVNLNDSEVRQSFVWVRQGLRKRAALHQATYFNHACEATSAPSVSTPIP
ncbi:MAG: hypothetical protein R3325_07425 [Thermoanaerobaculia bacterium]|nr:hypothetical protein [Thermoanaerobaculia bacterium]